MGGDFDDVVGGVGVRLGEERDHYFVNALLRGGLDQLAEGGAARFQAALEAQQGRGDGTRVGAGEANHA